MQYASFKNYQLISIGWLQQARNGSVFIVKTVILDLRQAVQIHERKKEYKLFTQIIIMK